MLVCSCTGTAKQSMASTLLPRMPMGLALMTAERTYEAVAGVARSLGRIAACAGTLLPASHMAQGRAHIALYCRHAMSTLLACCRPCIYLCRC